MSSAWKHRKRAHRSEKRHTESARQMKRFSPRAGVTLPLGIGVFSVFGRHFPGRKRKREKQAAQ